MVLSIIILPTVLFLVHMFTKQLQLFTEELGSKTYSLDNERRRSQNLLHQIMPAFVARNLMRRRTVPPEHFSSVSVYFADIVGFTKICDRCTPLDVVTMLGLVFRNFDIILERYDAYKVETIGNYWNISIIFEEFVKCLVLVLIMYKEFCPLYRSHHLVSQAIIVCVVFVFHIVLLCLTSKRVLTILLIQVFPFSC